MKWMRIAQIYLAEWKGLHSFVGRFLSKAIDDA